MKQFAKKTQDALAKATEVASERLSNIRTVRAFGTEKNEMRFYGGGISLKFR